MIALSITIPCRYGISSSWSRTWLIRTRYQVPYLGALPCSRLAVISPCSPVSLTATTTQSLSFTRVAAAPLFMPLATPMTWGIIADVIPFLDGCPGLPAVLRATLAGRHRAVENAGGTVHHLGDRPRVQCRQPLSSPERKVFQSGEGTLPKKFSQA
jgi:hypothetical protein